MQGFSNGPGQVSVVAGFEDVDYVDGFEDVEQDAYWRVSGGFGGDLAAGAQSGVFD